MRFKFIFFYIILIAIPSLLNAQTVSTARQKAIVLTRVLQKNHFAPRELNDSFSSAVFSKVLEELDPYKIYFNQQQVAQLAKYRYAIDDEINNGPWTFSNELSKLYQSAMDQSNQWVKQLIEKPVNFNEAGFFDLRVDLPFAKEGAEWKKRWQDYLKWRLLTRINDDRTEEEDEDSMQAAVLKPLPPISSEWFKNTEAEMRKQVAKSIDKRMKVLVRDAADMGKRIDKILLNVIANCFDPHSNYFDPETNDEFSRSLSSESVEFGFSIDAEDEGEFTISALKPGGAAWNTGNIFKDDKLIQIKLPDGKMVDTKDVTVEELEELLGKLDKDQIELTLKSADGKTKSVILEKEVVENEENTVIGFLLNGSKKVGYIGLPSFYTEWNGEDGNGCANDLSKEIIKLKREQIDGLILDLRYNGGGSLQEAVDISGIFIDSGPMCIVKELSDKMQTLKDPSRGTIYTGPLVVLINGQSASASELVAGTLQDYKRAVIVGSPSFGKATMQVVLPLDSTINLQDEASVEKMLANKNEQTDFVKTTVGKLYRISGKTNQLKGVIPDIALPDVFETMDYSESSMPFALPSDSIEIKMDYAPLKNMDGWKNKAALQQTILQQPYFADLGHWVKNQKLKEVKNKIPLQWEAFVQWDLEQSPPDEEDKKYLQAKQRYQAVNTSFTNRLLQMDNAYQQELNQTKLSALNSDLYIDAAYQAILQIAQ